MIESPQPWKFLDPLRIPEAFYYSWRVLKELYPYRRIVLRMLTALALRFGEILFMWFGSMITYSAVYLSWISIRVRLDSVFDLAVAVIFSSVFIFVCSAGGIVFFGMGVLGWLPENSRYARLVNRWVNSVMQFVLGIFFWPIFGKESRRAKGRISHRTRYGWSGFRKKIPAASVL